MGAALVVEVTCRFELEGGVLDIEVAHQACLDVVEQPRGVSFGEA